MSYASAGEVIAINNMFEIAATIADELSSLYR